MTQDINIFAAPRLRAKRFNRVKREEYVQWLCDLASVPVDMEMQRLNTRTQIDNYIESLISKPEWVQAAEEVIAEEPVEEVVEEDLTDAPFDRDYDSWTVAELREECKARGLTIRGTKAEVVLRLRRDDEGIEQETVETDNDETEAPAEAAAEESSDAPSEEEAATEEVTNNDESSEQEEDTNE